MDEEATTHALIVFGLSLLAGPAIGGLVGWLKSCLLYTSPSPRDS